MVDEGHSIGLHSMSQSSKSKLYSSDKEFLKEMLECQETIKRCMWN